MRRTGSHTLDHWIPDKEEVKAKTSSQSPQRDDDAAHNIGAEHKPAWLFMFDQDEPFNTPDFSIPMETIYTTADDTVQTQFSKSSIISDLDQTSEEVYPKVDQWSTFLQESVSMEVDTEMPNIRVTIAEEHDTASNAGQKATPTDDLHLSVGGRCFNSEAQSASVTSDEESVASQVSFTNEDTYMNMKMLTKVNGQNYSIEKERNENRGKSEEDVYMNMCKKRKKQKKNFTPRKYDENLYMSMSAVQRKTSENDEGIYMDMSSWKRARTRDISHAAKSEDKFLGMGDYVDDIDEDVYVCMNKAKRKKGKLGIKAEEDVYMSMEKNIKSVQF